MTYTHLTSFDITGRQLVTVLLLLIGVQIQAFAQPATGAPTPPDRSNNEVISIFSGAYTNVEGTNFNPNWQQATVVTTEQIDGNATLKYENFNYQGIEIGTSIDVTGMEYLHLDMWTSNASAVSAFLISPGPAETPYSLPIVENTWQSYDIPLSEFSDVVDLSDVFQFKFTDSGVGDSPTIYIDNIYFFTGAVGASSNATLSGLKIGDFPVPGFSSSIFEYVVPLSSDATVAPVVSAKASDENAQVVVTPADGVPGTATVTVTAEDGTTENVYTVEFVLLGAESDATLSGIQVGGIDITDFSSYGFQYVYHLTGDETAPEVTATATVDSATVTILPTGEVPGSTSIFVTSNDSLETNVYSVFFATENLLWWDEFSASDLNTGYWSYDIGDGCQVEGCGWGNFELQAYTEESVYIDSIPGEPGNNALVIEARNESNQFTSGRINSQKKVDLKYGIVEVRMRVPDLETGLWPAAWMLGSNHSEVGWPQSGEIDIMEMGQMEAFRTGQGFPNSTENNFVGANVIWYAEAACNAGNPTCSAAIAGDAGFNNPYVSATPMTDRFQTYRLYWNDAGIRLTVEDNGVEHELYADVFSYGNNAELQSTFTEPFYMILNLAVGGTFTDALQANQITAPLPAKMYVDYVRLYEYNGQGEVFLGGMLTSSEEEFSEQPKDVRLLQNYPNPFNPSTNIQFELNNASNVTVAVYDILGRKVTELVNGFRSAGAHTVTFDANSFSSGFYLYQLKVDGAVIDTKKMLLIK
ncbi:MAG: family 16 glycosylhydrolase [Balneolales bacterium]|nr:family 16 glycosylhydrolase [Balneolales bacterium]